MAQQGDPASFFDPQLAILNRRFSDEFASVLDRIGVLATGLKQIYHYADPLPASTSTQPFDDVFDWVRGAGEFLVRFCSTEQTYVISVSVRALQTGPAWDAGLSADGHSGAWDFDVPETLFPGQQHVRLRGMSGYVVSDQLENLYNAAVSVPRTATIRYLDGSTFSIDQSSIPVLRVGRLQSRLAVREADIVGTNSAFNVSPIGRWRVVITDDQLPPAITDEPGTVRSGSWLNIIAAKLQDLTLDFHVAVRND